METWNADYLDKQYALGKIPKPSHRTGNIFRGFELGLSGEGVESACTEDQASADPCRSTHVSVPISPPLSCLDPLVACLTDHPLLTLSRPASPADLEQNFTNFRPKGHPQEILKPCGKPTAGTSVWNTCIFRPGGTGVAAGANGVGPEPARHGQRHTHPRSQQTLPVISF
jgi:hypothetical protein